MSRPTREQIEAARREAIDEWRPRLDDESDAARVLDVLLAATEPATNAELAQEAEAFMPEFIRADGFLCVCSYRAGYVAGARREGCR